jgi:hypothetical protein
MSNRRIGYIAGLLIVPTLTACGAAPADDPSDPAAGDRGADAGDGELVAQTTAALTGATTCAAFVDTQVNWILHSTCVTPPGIVAYSIASHRPSDGRVTVATGVLNRASLGFTFVNPLTHTTFSLPSTISGTAAGSETFSDRSVTATVTGQSTPTSFSFDPQAADALELTLSDNGVGIIRLLTAGGQVTIQTTECLNNLMYGFGSDGVLYSIQLSDTCVPG